MDPRTIIIIGNVISLIGASVMVAIGFIKNKDKVILAQCAQFGIMGLGNLVLGGYTAVVSNAVSIVRNLFCLKWKFTTPLKLIFIAIQLILAYLVNQDGIIGWLPVIAGVLFTWFLDTKSDITLKVIIIITEIMWVVFDVYKFNYTSMTFDILTIITNTIGIITIRKTATLLNSSKSES